MNDLPLDIIVQIYSHLTNRELLKLTGTVLWHDVLSLLSSDNHSRMFWKMRVAHLSRDDQVIQCSLDIDWQLIYSFVVSYGAGIEGRVIEDLSRCDFDLADYSFHHDALKLSIEANNIRTVSLLLQAGSGDRESLIRLTSDLLDYTGKTIMTSLLVDYLREPMLDRHLQAVRERSCVAGSLVVFLLLSGSLLLLVIVSN